MALKLAVILIGGLAGNALAEVPHDPPNSLEKAFSMTGVAPSITTMFTTDLSSEEKMLKWSLAREEACLFIASDGAIRGAFFEQALARARSRYPAAALSDGHWALQFASAR